VERDEYGKIRRVRLSARTGEGLDLLRQALVEFAKENSRSMDAPVVDVGGADEADPDTQPG